MQQWWLLPAAPILGWLWVRWERRYEARGGAPMACGWLKDRYGLAWQVVPRRLIELISGPDRAAAERAMQAMMEMVKLDIAAIERAAAGA